MNIRRRIAVKLLARSDTDKIIGAVSRSRLRSAVYKLGSQCLIDRKFPLHLYLELSRNCNYNCPMCMRASSGEGGHFPVRLAEKIVGEAKKYGPTSFSLHLFGEPLINTRWDEIVGMIRMADSANAILLTTNGCFLNENTARKLIEMEVDRVFVSLHSLDPDEYRRNTGGGDVDRVINNLKVMSGMLQHAKKTKVYARIFAGKDEMVYDKQRASKIFGMGIKLELRGYHNFAGGKNEWTTYGKEPARWPCYHPWYTLGVAVNGDITVCCTDYAMGLKVGNALSQTIEEVWRSEAVADIRKEHLRGQFKKCGICSACDTWQFHPDIFFKSQRINSKIAM